MSGVSGPGRELVATARTKRSLPHTLKISAGCGKTRPLSLRPSSSIPPKNMTLCWGRDHQTNMLRRARQNGVRKDFRLNVAPRPARESSYECCGQGLTGGEIRGSILALLDLVQAGKGAIASAPIDKHRLA